MRTLQTNQLFYMAVYKPTKINKLFVFVGKYNKVDNPQQTFKKAIYSMNKSNFKATGISTTYDYTAFDIAPLFTNKNDLYHDLVCLAMDNNIDLMDIIIINKQFSERLEFNEYIQNVYSEINDVYDDEVA